MSQERLRRAIAKRKADPAFTQNLRKDHDMQDEVIQYNFSDALVKIRQGHRMQRAGWNGKGMFVFLAGRSVFTVNREPLLSILGEGTRVTYRPHIDIYQPDGSIGVWQPSICDIMAEDWQVVSPS